MCSRNVLIGCLLFAAFFFGLLPSANGGNRAALRQPQLSGHELSILSEVKQGLTQATSDLAEYRCTYSKERIRVGTEGKEVVELRLKLDVERASEVLIRATSHETLADGREKKGVFLVNGENGWNALSDPKTQKYYIAQHGASAVTGGRIEVFRFSSSFHMSGFNHLSDLIFGERSTVASISEEVDQTGERLVNVSIDRVPVKPELFPPGFVSKDQVTLYRDRQFVIKNASCDEMNSRGDLIRRKQDNSYQPFAASPPLLRKMENKLYVGTRATDSLAIDWRLVTAETADFSEFVFQPSDRRRFEIGSIVDMSSKLSHPRAGSIKWFFGGIGLILLAVWYFLARKKDHGVSAVNPTSN